MSLGAKVAAGALLVSAAVGGAGWYTLASKGPAPSTSQPAVSTPAMAGPELQRPVERSVSASSTHAAEADEPGAAVNDLPLEQEPAKAGPAQPTHARSMDLDAELRLISAAQDALRRGDGNAALAALERHRSQHPTGALSVEREALRAEALCRVGRTTEGRALASKFSNRHPDSPLVQRLSKACSQ